jgi:hypothetical protein
MSHLYNKFSFIPFSDCKFSFIPVISMMIYSLFSFFSASKFYMIITQGKLCF